MPAQTLNLGILAHVDAGKTSLTERLLFDNGSIEALGSVDGGNTATDTSELERQRGITIRSAVASFALGDLQVNLVDTPGHPDFIAEVERALSVLDGAILVMSAVEGVQAQTRVLMKSLQRMRLPTILFVNKIDRMGARYDELLEEIRRRLGLGILPMERVEDLGTRRCQVVLRSLESDEAFRLQTLELLADHDDDLMARAVEGSAIETDELLVSLHRQTLSAMVYPVYFGSALSGAGSKELTDAVQGLLVDSSASRHTKERLRGRVFAIERSPKGEKVAYLRLFSGVLSERQRVTFHHRGSSGAVEDYVARISGLEVVGVGPNGQGRPRSGPLTAGNIAKLRGIAQVRVGDEIGDPDDSEPQPQFSPPILESIVRPCEIGREGQLHAALTQLADEDPLIRTRPAGGGGTSVLLYGEVQKEVIAERLRREFRIEVVFDNVQPVYFERPAGVAEALHEFEPQRVLSDARGAGGAGADRCRQFRCQRGAIRTAAPCVSQGDRGRGNELPQAGPLRLGGDRLRRRYHPTGL